MSASGNADTNSSQTVAPPGWQTVIPRIFVENHEALVVFLREVFDAQGDFNTDRPSELRMGDCIVMISSTLERATHTAFLYVYVADVDLVYTKAMSCGAIIIEPPAKMPYGDIRTTFEDPWGNTWQVASRAE